ncbi:MAG: hypothetical protein HGB19_13660 [Chlorobiales bacterium]|nr:hypothetical protein [Chlorobiales bacterium]
MMCPPRHFFILLLLNLFFCRTAHASFEHLETSSRAMGMGGAFTALSSSSFAIFYNPAGQALLSSREAGFFYTHYYGFDELSQFSASYTDPVLLPTGAGTIGLGVKQYGFELYRETTFAISYANSFERKFFYALTATYNHLTIQGYGNDAAVGIDAGVLALITPSLSIGFSALNLNRPTLSASNEPLAQSYTLGLCYHLSKELRVLADAEKDPRFPLMIKSGVEFDPIPILSLRGGFSSEPSRISAGIGLHYGMFNIDYALATHPDLGITHFGSVSVYFGNKGSKPQVYGGLGEVIDKAFSAEEKIDLNSAGASDLLELPGITRQLAQRILMYREEYGAFKSVSELLRIRGISEDVFDAIKESVTVGEVTDE